MSGSLAEGPWFEELAVGQVFDRAPTVTLTEGRAAVHQAVVGDRLRLPLDDELARAVAGVPLAHPAHVWNTAIGQSTLATQHVKANLFYRNLVLLRAPAIGDALSTVTTVVGLRENARREGREPTGLAALHIQTRDQLGRPVLDFHRCAMLPLRDASPTGHADDLDAIGWNGPGPEQAALGWDVGPGPEQAALGWDVGPWRRAVGEPRLPDVGTRVDIAGGDVVVAAPELARLTLNIASVHQDARAGGGTRLVYGGHTIGLALGQVCRALPDVATVLAWDGCDHVGPVREGDTLRSSLEVEGVSHSEDGWARADVRVETLADTGEGPGRPVLRWCLTLLL